MNASTRNDGKLTDVGWPAYLAELWDATPTAANSDYYAGIVREKAALRAVIHATNEAVRDAYDQADEAATVAGRLGAALEAAVADRAGIDPVPIGEAVALGVDDFERRHARDARRLWTGFQDLDALVPGFDPASSSPSGPGR